MTTSTTAETTDSRPLLWAAAAFVFGVLLHIDRLPPWTVVAAAACVIWRLAAVFRPVPLPSQKLRLLLTMLLVAGVLAMYRSINGLSAGTALLVVMGAAKLLETRIRRDQYVMIGAALVLLLAACLDRQTLLRAPLYLLHAWLCCAALAVISHPESRIDNRRAASLAGRSLLYALPLALLLFVFFPRLPGSFWTLQRDGDAVTGLSNKMSPGSISTLSESTEPAFRVWFEGEPPPPEERYWRGPVLHEFDGYTWSQERWRAYSPVKFEPEGQPYRYRITLEPHSQPWLFTLDLMTSEPHRGSRLSYDHQLLSFRPVTQQISYEATSHTRVRATSSLSLLGRRIDTMLPENRNPRSLALAQRMRSEAGSDAQFIQNVLQYFREGGFQYTLTPPRLNLNSVDDFLFNTRKGFCGHYASAFVTLMRAAGIPARVVTGYMGGEWNPVGEYFIIRQSDAHAWAEVWLEGRGWTRVDPTAVVSPERLRRDILDLLPNAGSVPARILRNTPALNRIAQTWDAVNAWWRRQVIEFDMQLQLDLLRKLGFESPDWRTLGWLLAAGLIGWLAWVAWHVGRAPSSRRTDPLARAYERACRKLVRTGVVREPHMGPLAYAEAIADRRPDLARPVLTLMRQYADLRYGRVDDPATALREFERGVSRLRIGGRREAKLAEPFPQSWRDQLASNLELYRRMPPDLRRQLEPLVRAFLADKHFVGCDGLEVTDTMRLIIAVQACLLVVRRDLRAYDDLHSILIYPEEFVVTEVEEDEAGVVTEGTRAISGQTIDTDKIVLSWKDVQEGSSDLEVFNVVLHEFAHYLDHTVGGVLSDKSAHHQALAQWHAVLEREYTALCEAVDQGEETLIDPYGAEDPAEFFAVATETFFERPREMEQRHAHLYEQLREFYGLDPARW